MTTTTASDAATHASQPDPRIDEDLSELADAAAEGDAASVAPDPAGKGPKVKPRGALRGADDDPAPIPITWSNIWRWALLTYRAERRYYTRLGRTPRLTSKRLSASILPSIDRPIFVVGAARSGTTFLGDCVGHLPEVSYHHEPPATKAAGRYVYEGAWGFRRSRWFYRSVYGWLLRVELDGNLRFCDKTPTNALLMPFLDEAFSGAQFIHLIRDGRDVAASHIRQPWLRADAGGSGKREPGGYLHGPYAPWWVEPQRRNEFETTSDAHRMIWAWRRYTEAALRDGRALPSDRYLEVRYETLVSQPRQEGDRILDFLGISRPSSRAAFLGATDRAEGGSLGSWRKAFDATAVAEIESDSGALLQRLGYTDS